MRVGIIGMGWVGSSIAISTLHSGVATELLVTDVRAAVAEGEALDLAQGASFIRRRPCGHGRRGHARSRRGGHHRGAGRTPTDGDSVSGATSPRHAHGSHPGSDRRGTDCRYGRSAARRRDLSVRRRAVLTTHRARHRRVPPSGADRDNRPARVDRPPGRAETRLSADRSGDADVSGAADPGQPRARRPRSVPRFSCPPAAGWRAAGGHLVPLARGSDREAHVPCARAGGEAVVRVLTKRPLEPADDEIARNPRARSAKLRAIERLA